MKYQVDDDEPRYAAGFSGTWWDTYPILADKGNAMLFTEKEAEGVCKFWGGDPPVEGEEYWTKEKA